MPSSSCRCDPRFTCGYCLRNAKPLHYTLSSGVVLIPPPVDLCHPSRRTSDAQGEES
jgi:hypothetical protein